MIFPRLFPGFRAGPATSRAGVLTLPAAYLGGDVDYELLEELASYRSLPIGVELGGATRLPVFPTPAVGGGRVSAPRAPVLLGAPAQDVVVIPAPSRTVIPAPSRTVRPAIVREREIFREPSPEPTPTSGGGGGGGGVEFTPID